MTVNYTTLLALGQPVTGTESGTWGDDVNNAVTSYLDIAIAGTLTFTGDGAITLANTQGTNSATNIGSTSAQYAVLRFTGTLTTTKVVTAPSTSKIYLVDNATSGGFGVTIKASGQTGYTVSAGTKAWVYYNGTDYVLASTNDINKLTGTLAIANGGTNATATPTAGAVAYGTGTAYAFNSAGTSGQALISGGSSAPTFGTLGTGAGGTGLTSFTSGGAVYATSTSALTTGTLPIASGGTNATATPTAGAIAYGTGTAYAFTSAGSAGQVLQSNGASAPTWANAATGTVTAVSVSTANGFAGTSSGGATPALTLTTSVTGLLKGNGTAMSAATAGTDYVAPATATTFTATQTFSGSTSVFAASLLDANETVNVVGAAPSATTNFYVQSGSVQYYTSNAANNWTLNIAFSSGTSLNTALATGQSVTFTLITTQGSTAYYANAITIDGSAVTPKWIGGAPTAGNASGLDVYRFAVVKTASATYTVLASLTQFK